VALVQPMPYTVVQTLLDPGHPPGRNNYWKAENLSELGGEAIDTIVAHASQMTSPFSQVVVQPWACDQPCGRRRDRSWRPGRGLRPSRDLYVGESGGVGHAYRLDPHFFEAMESFTTPSFS
jgi:hypothetical protein